MGHEYQINMFKQNVQTFVGLIYKTPICLGYSVSKRLVCVFEDAFKNTYKPIAYTVTDLFHDAIDYTMYFGPAPGPCIINFSPFILGPLVFFCLPGNQYFFVCK